MEDFKELKETLQKRIEELEARPIGTQADEVVELIVKHTLTQVEKLEVLDTNITKNLNEATQKFCDTEISAAQLKVDLTKAFTDLYKELDTRHMLKIEEVEGTTNTKFEIAEKHTRECVATTEKCILDLQFLQDRFKSDYADFVVQRKRWKGDFDKATNVAMNNFNGISGLLENCL